MNTILSVSKFHTGSVFFVDNSRAENSFFSYSQLAFCWGTSCTVLLFFFVSRRFHYTSYLFSAIILRSCLTLPRSSRLLFLALTSVKQSHQKINKKKSLNTSWKAFYLFCLLMAICIFSFKSRCIFIPIRISVCVHVLWLEACIVIHQHW